jgi:hypothetical protein
MELDLKINEHKDVVDGLRKQVAVFESRPSQEAAVRELQEQLTEMDILMSQKNEEIENNDDIRITYARLPSSAILLLTGLT